jgi:hypothetical protein
MAPSATAAPLRLSASAASTSASSCWAWGTPAAYDSRDGPAGHPNESSYHAAERKMSWNPTIRTCAASGQAPIDAEIGGTDQPILTWSRARCRR